MHWLVAEKAIWWSGVILQSRHRADRVLVVISSIGGGGAERVALDLCQCLHECGREVTLLTLAGNSVDVYPVPAGVHRERMEIRRPARWLIESVLFTIQHLAAMRRKLLALRPDVVVCFMDQTNVRILASLVGTRIPVIVSERAHPGIHQISWSWKIARRLTYPMARAVVVQTEEIAEWFVRWLDARLLAVIPNAVRRTHRKSGCTEQTSGCNVVLAIGRLTRQKGFDLLLDAFRGAHLVGAGWKLVILGEGPDRDALQRHATALGIDQAVIMPGFVPDVDNWLSRADLFVLSSRYEGFPNALLEAMQLGRACVSFDCPSGPRALIEHGLNGWLVPAEDVDALTGALCRLTADPVLRAHLGSEAEKVGGFFSPERVYGRWVELIDEVAEAFGRSAIRAKPSKAEHRSRRSSTG